MVKLLLYAFYHNNFFFFDERNEILELKRIIFEIFFLKKLDLLQSRIEKTEKSLNIKIDQHDLIT